MIQFDLPQKKSSIIKVFGVGGGGGNAVNFMHSQGIQGVDFVLCNTDVKALESSTIPNKIQLGPNLTEGLGAGADPEIGELATEESIAEITNILKDNTKMVFVTAGMGGGTGTGGAPIVAKVAKDLKILTVGIVTTPFSHEGKRRMKQANEGIAKMRGSVDTILVISNDKLRHQFGNLGFKEAFSKADDVLATATRCITDVINSRGHVIVDFADVCTVMRNGGVAILGSASAVGENRAQEAVENAINSPLLNDDDIQGAKWVLINITSAEGAKEHTLDEMDLIQNYVQSKAGDDCDVILGTGYDNTLGEGIGVTIIATGFEHNNTENSFDKKAVNPQDAEVIHTLNQNNIATNNQANTNIITNASNNTEVTNNIVEALMPTLVVEQPAIPTMLGFSMRPQVQVLNTPPDISTSVNNMPEFIIPTTPELKEANSNEVEKNIPTPDLQELESNIILFELEDAVENKQQETNSEMPTQQPIISEINSVTTQDNNAIQDDFITRQGITINRKVGSRYLTEDEIVEKINFELQKKAFEDRANKLRNFNFNVNSNSANADLENVPAYLRSKTVFEQDNSQDQLSNYTVNANEINSRNNFLDGNKPD